MYSTPSRSLRSGSTGARKSENATSLINPLSFVECRDDDRREQIELRRWMKVEVKSLENEKLAS
ncbi:MAG: hypothetical protein QF451_05475 [Nitrospinota bacterium]|jgi:hypothetical protein|nr:hypothetical protein [Nitrospinota bacterium]MDP7503380.1 hypothetical protein [Nitrospinota bacterium]MDP7662707.1 hypothetical protein [Nitrospinota bacterium]